MNIFLYYNHQREIIKMEFSKDELKLLEIYLLSELDTQRYEPDGIDEELEKLYYKVKAKTNLEFEVHSIMEHLKTI